MAAGESTVGSIIGFLRLDTDQWDEALRRAGAEADALGEHSPKIKVTADTEEAERKFAEVAAEADALGEKRVDIKANEDTQGADNAIAQMIRRLKQLDEAKRQDTYADRTMQDAQDKAIESSTRAAQQADKAAQRLHEAELEAQSDLRNGTNLQEKLARARENATLAALHQANVDSRNASALGQLDRGLRKHINSEDDYVAAEQRVAQVVAAAANETDRDRQVHMLAAKTYEQTTRAVVQLRDAMDRVAQARAAFDAVDSPDNALRLEQATRRLGLAEQHLANTSRQGATAMEKLSASMDAAAKKADQAGQAAQTGVTGWAQWLALLAPLATGVVPLAAGLAGIGGGLIGMAAVAGIAFVSIKNGITNGTVSIASMQGAVNALKADWSNMETLIGQNVLGGLDQGIQSLSGHMGALTTIVDILSRGVGGALGPALDGVLNMMVNFTPVFAQVAAGADHVATEFDRWSMSSSAIQFIDYIRQSVPQAAGFISGLAGAVAHVIEAFAPIGSAILPPLNLLLHVLDMIPTPLLTLGAGVAAAAFAFQKLGTAGPVLAILKTQFTELTTAQDAERISLAQSSDQWSLHTAAVDSSVAANGRAAASMDGVAAAADGETAALDGTAAASETAGLASVGLKGALGGVLGIVTIAITAWSLWQNRNAAVQAEEQQLAQAIEQSNGAMSKQVAQVLAGSSVFQSAAADLAKYGISSHQLLEAELQGGPAVQALTDKVKAQSTVSAPAANNMAGLGKSTTTMSQSGREATLSLDKLTTTMDGARKAADAQKTALDGTAASTTRTASATSLATKALLAAGTAAQKQQTALQADTSALDALTNASLGAYGAQNNLDSAVLSVDSSLKTSHGSVSEYTQNGLAARQAVLAWAQSVWAERDANIQNGMSIKEADQKALNQIGTMQRQIDKTYGVKSAVAQLVHEYGAVPKEITTQINAYTAAAQANVQGLLNSLAAVHSKSVTVDVMTLYQHSLQSRGVNVPHSANGNIFDRVTAYAGGGVEDHSPQIAYGTRVWAEPETDGEAYIPFAASKRARATSLLGDVAGRFGMALVPVSGATLKLPATVTSAASPSSSTTYGGSTTTVHNHNNVTVNGVQLSNANQVAGVVLQAMDRASTGKYAVRAAS